MGVLVGVDLMQVLGQNFLKIKKTTKKKSKMVNYNLYKGAESRGSKLDAHVFSDEITSWLVKVKLVK